MLLRLEHETRPAEARSLELEKKYQEAGKYCSDRRIGGENRM